MTKPRDPEALLTAYLAGGMEVLPDRVVDSVLDEVHRTRQRVLFRRGRTRSTFRTTLAAAAIVAMVAVGGAFAVVVGPSPTPSAHPSPSLPGVVAPSSTASATATDPSGFPSSIGVWIPTGSMGTPRSGETAVRLLDGRVLVVGGADGDEDDASAELYDPTSGTWSATGSMLKPRGGFGATLLRDGKVLIGDVDDPDADNPVMGAELYDPATGTWSATGTMVWGGYSTATLLLDGKVLARSDGGSELFDPDTGTWTATRSRPTQRHGQVATILLPDGKVLVVGGRVDDYTLAPTDSAELYDPATGSWTAAASIDTPRYQLAATLLPDGTVLLVGRAGSTAAQVYEPDKGSWVATGDLARPGADYESMTLLADGTVLLIGTVGDRADPSAELYDPDTRSWTTTWSTLGRHEGAAATQLLDGTVLVAGGGTDTAELYVPAGVSPPAWLPAAPDPTNAARPQLTGAWIATGSMVTPRDGHTAVRLLDGRVLVAGGSNDGESDTTSAELYDPESGTWSPTGNMLKPYGGFAATLLRDGRVLVGDNDDPDGEDPNIGAEVYDPDSGTWTATGRMVFRKECCLTPTLLGDGRVLVTGREGNQLFDPDSGTWTATGKMITRGLGDGPAVLLPDGKVLVPGGHIYPRSFESSELYDPDTGTWTAAANMNAPHDEMTVTLLRDGTVLVAGRSTSSSSSRSAELYDPASGTWTVTGDMISWDSDYRTATLLLDGTVLVTGSRRDPELYDPGTRSWTPFWTMLGPHDEAPATLLLDGRVLVAGGTTCSTDTGDCVATGLAELYDPGAVSTAAPPPTFAPTPTPAPTPAPPQAGPGGRPWIVTVSNRSSQPATLFVAEETEQGLLGPLVGSATPNVVQPGTTVEVTFLVPATGVERWSIFVDTGPDTLGLVGGTDVPPTCSIHINEEGGAGWICEH